MAEQYSSINSSGPNIDIQLYPDAQLKGTQIGTADPSTAGSIGMGVTDAVNNYMSTVSMGANIKNTQANTANTQANTQATLDSNAVNETTDANGNTVPDQSIVNAKKQVITNEGATAAKEQQATILQTGVDAANHDVEASTYLNQVKTAAAAAAQAQQDVQNKQQIQNILGSPQGVGQPNTILSNQSYMGTMQRDSDYGNQILGQLQNDPRVDPTLLESATNSIDASALQDRRDALLSEQQKATDRAAAKRQDESDAAIHSLQGTGDFSDLSQQKGFYPDKLQVYPKNTLKYDESGKVQINPLTNTPILQSPDPSMKDDHSGVFMHGDHVISPYVSPDDMKGLSSDVQTYKRWAAAKGMPMSSSKAAQSAQQGDSSGDDSGDSSGTTPPTQNLGLAKGGSAGQAQPSPVPTSSDNVNQTIIAQQQAKNAAAFQQAQKTGQGAAYTALAQQGANYAKAQMTPTPDYIKTSQATPIPLGTKAITTAIPTPEAEPAGTVPPAMPTRIGTPEAEQHLSNVMGGAQITLNTNIPTATPAVTSSIMKKINDIPALDNQPAFIKGLVAVESAGNKDAYNKQSGATGLGQFMTGTAKDLGITDRTDPNQTVPGIEKYTGQQYDQIDKKLTQQLSDQGLSIKPDPRMVLASYNGGFGDIKRGIAAGNTTWDQMKTFLRSVKSPAAAEENIAYPDKVITASIPFIKGGNLSDDSYVKSLIQFGIVDVAQA